MIYTLDEVDFAAMTDEDLFPILTEVNRISREMQERSVDLNPDEFRVFASQPGMVKNNYLIGNDAGAIVGTFETRYAEDGTNPDVLRFQIRVWREHRRRGAGTTALGHVAGIAGDLGRGVVSASAVVSQTEPVHAPAAPRAMHAAI